MTSWASPVGPSMESVRYELQRFNATMYFSREVLEAMRLDRIQDVVSGEMAYRIAGMVATWREERLLRVPANWWQHFKQRFFPAWALKRWPVLYEVYDAAVILPRVPVVKPEYHTVEFPLWQKRYDRNDSTPLLREHGVSVNG